jgi:alpha-L-fucosidase
MTIRFGDARDGFFGNRFGLFVHWGLYAIDGWHEQELQRKPVPTDQYELLVDRFYPTQFDPDAWLDVMQDAGMQYLCFTTKHHDGFCMWHTRCTEYHIGRTPYKKDVLAMLADACHRRHVPLYLYYSVVDWHHPSYPNCGRHHELCTPVCGGMGDMAAYTAFVKDQLRELCTNYGKISGLFWDMNVPEHRDASVHAMIRELQPGIVINDRGFGPADYFTPEREVPAGKEFSRPTEACQSLGELSWGYKSDEDYFSDKCLMQSIDKTLAMGGNYLLNVGPMADGTIAAECVATLKRIGQWFASIRESLIDVEIVSRHFADPHRLVTRRGDVLYVHLCGDVPSSAIHLQPMTLLPKRATVLNTGHTLSCVVDRIEEWRTGREHLRVRHLPVNEMPHTVMVLKLEFTSGVLESVFH